MKTSIERLYETVSAHSTASTGPAYRPLPQYNIFLLNAPPRSGKDSFIEALYTDYPGDVFLHYQFKTHLIRICASVYGIPEPDFLEGYERYKEVPQPFLDGMSFRQALIKVSEEIVKPVYGPRYFGRMLGKSILTAFPGGTNLPILVSDGGFVEELIGLKEILGEECKVTVIQIFRPGCTFALYNDSRSYLPPSALADFVEIRNDGSFAEYVAHMRAFCLYDTITDKFAYVTD